MLYGACIVARASGIVFVIRPTRGIGCDIRAKVLQFLFFANDVFIVVTADLYDRMIVANEPERGLPNRMTSGDKNNCKGDARASPLSTMLLILRHRH